jgi:hypothetical protein
MNPEFEAIIDAISKPGEVLAAIEPKCAVVKTA